jgi:hypothetical protein
MAGAMSLSDKKVGDIMTPREKMVTIKIRPGPAPVLAPWRCRRCLGTGTTAVAVTAGAIFRCSYGAGVAGRVACALLPCFGA